MVVLVHIGYYNKILDTDNNKNSFFIALEVSGKFKIKTPTELISGKGLFSG
jgi:hypothetical protein